jgi:type VI secretion system protein ImpH
VAGEKRTAEDLLKFREKLLAEAPFYDFFVAVGMIERLIPEAMRVGGQGPLSAEVLRFRHDPSLTFKPGDVTRLKWVAAPQPADQAWDEPKQRFELTTAFMGVTGSATPLPLYMAEEILQSQDESQLQQDFLDLFHHRLISFVYRVGIKYDYPREFVDDLTDPWSRRVLALAGFDTWAGRLLRYVPMWRLLRLAPLLAARTRSARTLELILQDVCGEALGGASVRIEQFRGDWTKLDQEQRMALGISCNMLGQSSVLGGKCYHRAGKATIVIGPLGDNFRRFLKEGDMLPVILEVLDLIATDPIEFDLDLVLAGDARPAFSLGVREGGRIGTDAWLSSSRGPRQETHLSVELPTELPRDPNAFKEGWQAMSQKRPAQVHS